jgi:diguanylate cyclase (GGDEF)-like protein/PAS domain S-box-containing protein
MVGCLVVTIGRTCALRERCRQTGGRGRIGIRAMLRCRPPTADVRRVSEARDSAAVPAAHRSAAGHLRAPSRAQLRAVIDAQRILACAPPDPVVIFRLLAETAWSVLGCSGAVASQPTSDALVVRGVAGETPNHIGSTILLDGTVSRLAVRSKTGQICDDWVHDPRVGAAPVSGPLSFAVVPLIHEGEVIALLGAHQSRLAAFDRHDLELLAMLADVGAKRLAHALTLQSRDQLRAQASGALDAMTAGLLVQDLDGTIVFANPAAQALFGLTLEQIKGRSSLDESWTVVREDGTPWPHDTRPSLVSMRTGEPQRDQVMGLTNPQGDLRWLAINAVPMRDPAGAITGAICSFDDITSRRAADATLQDARRRLEAALDLAGLATWEHDLATGDVYWSPKLFAMFGLEPTSDAPDSALQAAVLEPDDRRTLEAMAAACIATRKPRHAVVRARWPDGTRRFLWTQMDVATNAAGEVTTLWGNTQDITEQEEAARVLAASEQHFRVAFDNAPIGMSMISLAPGSEGDYLRANAEFCAMVGYSADELVTLTMADLTQVDEVENDRVRFAQLVNGTSAAIAFDKHYRCKDGHTVFAWVTSSVACGPAGEPLFLITQALDMTPRRQQQAELERLALTDTLTGLANRTLLTDRLDQALARLHRVDGSCALLLLDIDRFKLVNDSLGHQVGDELLVEVASRIQTASRADSTVARLGGDEFVVLVEGLSETDSVHHIASRLLETLRRPYVIDDAADSVVLTVSIGISMATTADRSHGDLFREADLALYRAKDSGRDQYALFDSALRSRVDARMEAENLLRRALAEGLVTPFFQPLIDMTTGRIFSSECLARIALPCGKIIPPADFIDVAEETGLIVELDARMFEGGLRQFALWSAQPDLAMRTISTNVSARALEDPTFVDRMRRAMSWYGVDGSAIRMEITERSLLAPSPVVVESLRRVAELGIQVGLDDFGTGYSALAYLQRLDLAFLKIDRSFVSQLGNRRDDAVVAAVVALAHALELRVIAEGVETVEQLDALRAMGCDRAQGFLIGRPMPPDELAALIRTRSIW